MDTSFLLEQLGAIGGPVLIVFGFIAVAIITYQTRRVSKLEEQRETLISEQKQEAKETLTALVEFNHTLEKVLDRSDLSEISAMVRNLGEKVNEILLRISK